MVFLLSSDLLFVFCFDFSSFFLTFSGDLDLELDSDLDILPAFDFWFFHFSGDSDNL